jgi:lipopolysaccharide heptosyltransferase II
MDFKTMKDILVVNVNWVGDVIFSTPIFKSLKKAYPQAKIACLAPPRVKEILENIPQLDEIIIYDEDGKHKSPWGKLKLIGELRRHRFDVAFLLHRSLTRALLIFLAGIRERVGYDTKGRGFLLTHKVKPLNRQTHRADHYLNVIESFGIKVEDRTCELKVSAGEEVFVAQILQKYGISESDFLVVVNPGGNWDLKRWPKENFIGLIERLTTEFGAKVVIPGAPQDVELADYIGGRVKGIKPIVLTGQTNLKQLTALLQRAKLLISADSGPLHLANCVGVDVIGLFGPTRPEITAPRGTGQAVILQHDVGCNRLACYNLGCPNNVCMKSITVEDILYEIKRLKN